MYTSLISGHDTLHPEKRSRSKAVFTLPLVLLFILVGVASTKHLFNVNANNDLESMLADPNKGLEDFEQAVADPTLDEVLKRKIEIQKINKKKAVFQDAADVGAGACHGGNFAGWWCIHVCQSDPDCKVILTLDMGSSGTKPSLWAIKQDPAKTKIPQIKMIGTNKKPEHKFKKFCGIWIDKNQFQGDATSHCTSDTDLELVTVGGKQLKESCFRNKDCAKTEQWSCQHLYATANHPLQSETLPMTSGSADLDLKGGNYFEKWIKHFRNQMKCFLNKELKSGAFNNKIKDYIDGIFGGVTAGLRNDPDIIKKFSALEEQTGPAWEILSTVSQKPVHIRMLSGEEEGYYEWLGYNWHTLREFTNADGQKVTDKLLNTFTMGGASAQIAIPTATPMSTLDHTYYFHIGVDKYWIYANSIMWGGSTRLANMVEDYVKNADGGALSSQFNIKHKNAVNLNDMSSKKIMDDFFTDNNKLLCADICSKKPCDNERLFKGPCVMGFHFPDTKQWLNTKFVGGKDYTKVLGKCLQEGSSSTPTAKTIKLDFNTDCDVPDSYKKDKYPRGWWDKHYPSVTLPFYGRFFNLLKEEDKKDKGDSYAGKEFELSVGEEVSWGAIWAAMWIHGKFQGFPDLAPAPTTKEFRRNLGGLKGEYTLGPLTIPAHFGTPEHKWSFTPDN